MNVITKEEIVHLDIDTEEEKELLIPGKIFKVLIHEEDGGGQEWYLIEVLFDRDNIYMSDHEVGKHVTRFYEDPSLPADYKKGPYMWIEASYFDKIVASTNKEAKSLLKDYEWHLK